MYTPARGARSPVELRRVDPVSQHHVVSVDVGGIVYKSTMATLCQSPKLAELFEKHDTTTELFVDRDGEPFRYVLSFLRTGRLLDLSKADGRRLFCEAEFYELPDLVAALDTFLTPVIVPWWRRGRQFLMDHYGKAFLALIARLIFKHLKKRAKAIGSSVPALPKP